MHLLHGSIASVPFAGKYVDSRYCPNSRRNEDQDSEFVLICFMTKAAYGRAGSEKKVYPLNPILLLLKPKSSEIFFTSRNLETLHTGLSIFGGCSTLQNLEG